MVRALREVRRRHPSLEIQLVHTVGDAAADDIRGERLDLAIVSRITPSPEGTSDGIKEWILGSDPLCLYVAADHRLASATAPVPISDLREEPWILSHNTRLGRLTSALCNAAGFEPVVAALVDDVSIAVRRADHPGRRRHGAAASRRDRSRSQSREGIRATEAFRPNRGRLSAGEPPSAASTSSIARIHAVSATAPRPSSLRIGSDALASVSISTRGCCGSRSGSRSSPRGQ